MTARELIALSLALQLLNNGAREGIGLRRNVTK